MCRNFNETYCTSIEKGDDILLAIYNPMPISVKKVISVPVKSTNYEVYQNIK